MKIKVTSIYVDDQERAPRFYTEVLGFVKKADVSQGPFRWLTKEISLRIPERKITIFTGASGSGKSSVFFDTISTDA